MIIPVRLRGHKIGATRSHELPEATLDPKGAPADHSAILAWRTGWNQSILLNSVGATSPPKIIDPLEIMFFSYLDSIELLFTIQWFVVPVQQNLTDWGLPVHTLTPLVEWASHAQLQELYLIHMVVQVMSSTWAILPTYQQITSMNIRWYLMDYCVAVQLPRHNMSCI